ncbi:hypothetical protein B0H13DRAFT_1722113 [Mycena leptocephala]|nr:hypothetical protein B0H13DRAFT_1722113 [Mycena leptocephala]
MVAGLERESLSRTVMIQKRAKRPSPSWTSTAAFAASRDIRRRIGGNVLPSKSLLLFMHTALKDKVLVLLSIAAVVSLAVGIFRPAQVPGEPQVYWVEGVAIMVAILIVVVVGSVNDWQKERQFETLNGKKEEKTDTLTQNVMTVVAGSVGIHAKFVRHLESNTRTNAIAKEAGVQKHSNDFSLDQSQLNSALSPQLRELFNEAIAVNSTAFPDKNPDTGELIFVGSKTETALLQFAQDLKWADYRTTRDSVTVLQMIPFSSERKAMGVVVKRHDGKFRFFLNGASEILSKKCVAHVVVRKDGDGIESATAEIGTAAIDELANDNIARTTIFYANQMLGTIALCYRDFDSWPPRDVMPDEQNEVPYDDLAHDLTLIGIVGIEDPLRSGVFRDLSLEEKIETVPRLQVPAHSSHKRTEILVETLQDNGEIVGVTADGTNDDPALHKANVGFSLGIAGAEVAQEASDIILMDDIFAKAIMWGRCANDAMRKFLQFPFSTVVTAVVITFVSAVTSVEESSVLSAVQPFFINIIAGTFAAIALATYLATKSLLNHKPNKKIAPLFSVEMCKQILFQSTYQFIITRIFHSAVRGILPADTDLIVQIPIFSVFVFAQIFDSVNSRHLDRKLNIFEGITKNWYFITNGQNLTGYVSQDGYYHFAGGGYSNVYKGTFIRSDGRKIPVCCLFFPFHR